MSALLPDAPITVHSRIGSAGQTLKPVIVNIGIGTALKHVGVPLGNDFEASGFEPSQHSLGIFDPIRLKFDRDRPQPRVGERGRCASDNSILDAVDVYFEMVGKRWLERGNKVVDGKSNRAL